MIRKEMIAMLLAGGQGSRLGVLTSNRMITVDVIQILVNCICRTCIPFTVVTFLIRGQYCDAAIVAVQIPRNTNSDMGIQTQRLIGLP